MTLGVRGSNPIWLLDDLTAHLFDDTFYMYVLENTLPYIPSSVYHDPNLAVAWSNPIQFLANGTLPIDIYFVAGQIYRLEFRQNNGINPPSQADALIYEVNNYSPGGTGSTPNIVTSVSSDNQITNPQFALINFESPYSVSATNPNPINIAPGWYLELAGTGTATISQVPLNSSSINPSNAPYALRLQLSGWNSGTVFLRQRLIQNGMLWANKTVSTALTTRVESTSVSLTAYLIDSNATLLGEILSITTVNSSFNEFTGHAVLPESTNPNTPPAAFIDYKLALPNTVDIYLTSIQLVVQDALDLTEPQFIQDSVNRQIDHTFNYYQDAVVHQPKSDLVVGWNFPLNPWQFTPTANTNIALAAQYTADQTIIVSEIAATLESLKTSEGYFGLQQVTSAATGKFALIQYINTTTIAAWWGKILSSMATVGISTAHGTQLNLKMRIIYRDTLPTITVPGVLDNPISSWSATDPAFTAGWTAIAPAIDNVYTISASDLQEISFEGFQLPAIPSTTAMIGIVLYSTNTLNSASVADKIYFEKISLVPNEFAVESPAKTFNQVLTDCQYYYEKNINNASVPGVNGGGGVVAQQITNPATGSTSIGTIKSIARSFGFNYNTIKRTNTPLVTIYSPADNAINMIFMVIYNGGANIAAVNAPIAFWTETYKNSKSCSFIPNTVSPVTTSPSVFGNFAEAFLVCNYTIDARIGLVA